MRAHAIIGANYGDEGKGLITDRVAHDVGAPVVVRANGGAQAGHTVCVSLGDEDGVARHVFHHFSAGTFAGASTFLSRFFVCNPALFMEEARELDTLGIRPIVWVDPRCYVTTPWDMLMNQDLERSRGDSRHGSCGVGFNETIQRCEASTYTRLEVWNLELGRPRLLDRIRYIRRYFLSRYAELGIPCNVVDSVDGAILKRWLDDVEEFLERIEIVPQTTLSGKDNIVFEGAQGLMLSMDNLEDFPHLTRSYTGIRNPLQICSELDIADLNVIYVTRTYSTRHGRGPLPLEGKLDFVPNDDTNTDHLWQESLRVAPLITSRMGKRIREDYKLYGSGLPSLAITHVDEPKERPELARSQYALRIASAAGFSRPKYVSYGPTRSDVVEFDSQDL